MVVSWQVHLGVELSVVSWLLEVEHSLVFDGLTLIGLNHGLVWDWVLTHLRVELDLGPVVVEM